jgi:mRNA interferase RelE/StbE
MPTNIRILILSKIEELAVDPFSANNVKKLEGRDGYRLRVGNWRVIYEVNGNTIVLYVVAIGARGGVYQ